MQRRHQVYWLHPRQIQKNLRLLLSDTRQSFTTAMRYSAISYRQDYRQECSQIQEKYGLWRGLRDDLRTLAFTDPESAMLEL